MRFFLLGIALMAVVGCSSSPTASTNEQDGASHQQSQEPVKSALSAAELEKYVGNYSMTGPSESGRERTILLTLLPDQTFKMKFSYTGEGGVPPFEGTWTLNGDQVEALVTKPAGMEERYVFELVGDTLKAVEYDKNEYGEAGLTLKKLLSAK